jgi:nucleoid-associated protein YgaU
MIRLWEPPKRRLRIQSRTRFVVFVLVVVLTVLAILIPKKETSQVSYKPYRVAYGDTYWQIAKQLQKQGYRPRADIRDIVHELISKSGIKPHELKEGDTIYVPDMEGLE